MSARPEDGQNTPAGDSIYNTWDHSRHQYSKYHVGDIHNNITYLHGPSSSPGTSKGPQDRLEEYVSKGAAHDSAERGTDAPKCFPETRKAVQDEMLSHVEHGEAKVVWLTGPAGAGKTAIMGSIADECHAKGWLAGSFFISASAMKVDRCSKQYLIPTLAYHLFQLDIPGLPTAILASIAANPSVFDKRLDQQVELLILTPIRKVRETPDESSWPRAILVDGVDECSADDGREFETESDRRRSKEDNQREVLSALIRAVDDPSFPFYFIIASRPEKHIDNYFSSLPAHATKTVFLDAKFSPKADIELYAKSMLNTIGMDCSLEEQWYSQVGEALGIEDVPRHLAQQSSGQFIYVATAIRYIQDKSGAPYKLLERVLNWQPRNCSNPFAALDMLYLGILQTSPDPALAVEWLHCASGNINLVTWTLFRLTFGPKGWLQRCILESFPGETEHLLSPLVSLVRIVDAKGNPDFYFYHQTLSDFLKDPTRCGTLHIAKHEVTKFWVHRCVEILKNKGPQGQIPPKDGSNGVVPEFCFMLSYCINHPHKKEYDASHLDWWFSHLLQDEAKNAVLGAFSNVHQNVCIVSHR
ncbi:hypothetical protein FA13DRAFT_1808459 [Coprinellus micaceus]|uniref:Nephrocystin 3-like N-terminal domain-containing protein n=1 Tax=Coprinellus micaceus TaxID=71717 RepID=A0A4Y7U2D2_COPMI|nr:hypothetical protein FA13DRAFT_1808459 [Coprinellus micaceus]